MNKNLIQGRRDGASWHNTAKPTGEVVPVNQAAVRGRTVFLPGEVCAVRAAQNSAEVIVIGKRAGVQTHVKIAGGLSYRKRHSNDRGIELGTGGVGRRGCPTLWTTNLLF